MIFFSGHSLVYHCLGTYLDEVSVLLTHIKQWRCLADVRVDPDTDAKTALLEALEISHCVREHLSVKVEVTPLIRLHPEAIEMEDTQWDVTVTEPIKEPSDGLFVIVGREAFTGMSDSSIWLLKTNKYPKLTRSKPEVITP